MLQSKNKSKQLKQKHRYLNQLLIDLYTYCLLIDGRHTLKKETEKK